MSIRRPYRAISRLCRTWRYRTARNRIRQRRSDFEQCYREAIDALPVITRAIFLAHLRENATYEALATRHGLSVSEIEQHIARALISLDRDLTTHFPGYRYVPSSPKGPPDEG